MANKIGIRVMVFAAVFFAFGFTAIASAATSGAEQIITKLPDETVAFVATSGSDELKPAFEKTVMGKMWNDPNVQTFVNSIKSEVISKIKKEMNDANSARIFDEASDFADSLLKRPMVIGAGIEKRAAGSTPSTPQADSAGAPAAKLPLFGFAIVDASSRQLEIAKAIIKFESLAPKGAIVDVDVAGQKMHWFADSSEVPGYWGFVGDYFVFAINDKSGIAIKNLRSKSGATVNYLADVEGSGDACVLYADIQKIAELIKTMAQQEEGQEGLDKIKVVSVVMKELGLADVKSLRARVGFSGQDVVVQEFIEIPQPRTGIPARLKPIDLMTFNLADSRASTATALNVDLGGIYDTVMNTIRVASPNEAYPDVDEAIKGFESKVGFNIRKDLLANFAGPIVFYSIPEGVLSDVPTGGFVLAAKVTNVKSLEKSLTSLSNFAVGDVNNVIQDSNSEVETGKNLIKDSNSEVKQSQNVVKGGNSKVKPGKNVANAKGGTGVKQNNNVVKDSNNIVRDSNAVKRSNNNMVQVKSQEIGGRTYHTFAVMPYAAMQILPTWTITDNNQLVVAMNQPLCVRAAARIKGTDRSDSIRMTAGFKKAVGELRGEPVYMDYTDSQVQFNAMLKAAQSYWPMLTMMSAGAGFKLPIALPSLSRITENMGSTIQYGYYDNKGVHKNYRGSGIEIVAAAGIGGGTAVLMAVLMPALTKSREQAQRVVSASHLSDIGKRMFVYANDYNDVYPPDLKELIEKADLPPKSLESPRKPKDFNGPSFIYIPGQNPMMESGNVLVYENPEFCKDGVNVLFNDGHVAFMEPAEFKKELEKTYKQLGKPMPAVKFGK